jgi:hypothetical protein
MRRYASVNPSAAEVGSLIAALFTRMSMRPCSASTAARTAANASVSPTSHVRVPLVGVLRRSSSSRVASSSARRAMPTVVAPRAARSDARRRPMPDDAPVTTAICPS